MWAFATTVLQFSLAEGTFGARLYTFVLLYLLSRESRETETVCPIYEQLIQRAGLLVLSLFSIASGKNLRAEQARLGGGGGSLLVALKSESETNDQWQQRSIELVQTEC